MVKLKLFLWSRNLEVETWNIKNIGFGTIVFRTVLPKIKINYGVPPLKNSLILQLAKLDLIY